MSEIDTITGKATRVRDTESTRGEAAVYKLDPPYMDTPYGETEAVAHEFVVVSAVDLEIGFFAGFRTSETMIFPSDGTSISDWGELAMVEYKSHGDALAQLGYEVVS